jgi:hypothetical protein
MEAIGFVVVMVAVAWLLYWVVTNDKAPKAVTTGPFAIREGRPVDEAKPAPTHASAPRGKKKPPIKPLPRLERRPPKPPEPPKS